MKNPLPQGRTVSIPFHFRFHAQTLVMMKLAKPLPQGSDHLAPGSMINSRAIIAAVIETVTIPGHGDARASIRPRPVYGPVFCNAIVIALIINMLLTVFHEQHLSPLKLSIA